jgi:AraC-like DNA-binding protein
MMPLEQRQTAEATESQAYYSPEEAGEILRIAAHLQDNAMSAEQLRAIAREAGVSDENLERAIQQYEQSRRAIAERVRKRAARRRWLKVVAGTAAAVLIAVAAYFALPLGAPRYAASFPQLISSEYGLETLLASSPTCGVYKAQWSSEDTHDLPDETVVIRRSDGQIFTAGIMFKNITKASIAPSGRHVALYDAGSGELYVVNTLGEGLRQVGRSGEWIRLNDHSVGAIAADNPIAGWSTSNGNDILQVRLSDGRTADIVVSAE